MDLSANQRGEIVVVDELFAIADFFEADEDGLEFGGAEGVAQMFEASGDGSTTAVFGQWEFGLPPADGFWIDDFVGFPFFEDAILVDARAMSEGVQSDDGLVAWNGEPTGGGDKA